MANADQTHDKKLSRAYQVIARLFFTNFMQIVHLTIVLFVCHFCDEIIENFLTIQCHLYTNMKNIETMQLKI